MKLTLSRGAPRFAATTPPTPLNDAPQGGFFLSGLPFSKPALSLDDQLALLKGRGLRIDDEASARRYLEHISYYRLSGYTRFFARPDDEKRQLFRDGVTFADVIHLYVFDRKLRGLLSEAFERIEVSVKGSLCYHGVMAAGPFWMTDPANFSYGAHAAVMKIICDGCLPDGDRHRQVFLEAFYKKYSDPYPPAWMITEVLSFGGMSTIYKHARGAFRIPVATQLGVQHDVLESWLHALTFARNVCAHHGRFWNRRFTIRAQIPKAYREVWPENARDKLYLRCCIAHHLLQRCGGDTTWHIRLRDLIAEYPVAPLESMGFPADWTDKAFWGFPA